MSTSVLVPTIPLVIGWLHRRRAWQACCDGWDEGVRHGLMAIQSERPCAPGTLLGLPERTSNACRAKRLACRLGYDRAKAHELPPPIESASKPPPDVWAQVLAEYLRP